MLNDTLSRLAEDLDRNEIDYAVIGAVALNQHGYQRFTHYIDILLSSSGLEKFRDKLVGLGYASLADKLDEFVRAKYIELWTAVENAGSADNY